MKFGVCGSMVVDDLRLGGIEVVPNIARLGYDYVELSLSHMVDLNRNEFEKLRESLREGELACECCNNLFPAGMRLTGPGVDLCAISDFIHRALERAGELGVEIIVFGSGEAKMVPAGYSMEKAFDQVVEVCKLLGKAAMQYGITIAIEPLRRKECNIINSLDEGMQLVAKAATENVKLMADYFHMRSEGEDLHGITRVADHLVHIHFAKFMGRNFPVQINEDSGYRPFFEQLVRNGYSKRISIEAYSHNLEVDACNSLALLKQLNFNANEYPDS